MTNRELLSTPKKMLTSMQQQQQHLLQIHLLPDPCPNPLCRTPVNVIEALGKTVDTYTGDEDRSFDCPKCHAPLRHVVPLVAIGKGWHWDFDDQRVIDEGWRMS